MKFTVNIDCTPEEARRFFGLPDVNKVNDLIMEGLEQRANENLDSLTDPQKFYDRMMSAGMGNMEAMQKIFASGLAGGMAGSDKK